jgi:hypothetical protein
MNKIIGFTVILVMFTISGLSAADDGGSSADNDYFFASQDLHIYAQSGDLNENPFALEGENAEGRKSVTKAVLLSLALPGAGEMYVGRTSRAVGFFIAEAGIWTSYAYFKHRQNWLEDDYINFAVQYAGVDPDGKGDFFFDMVGFYDNRDEYNKISRVYTRTNPFFPEVAEWDWQWESDTLRVEYRDIKNSSRAQGRNANFSLGLALANRVISAVDAWWSAKSYNRRFSPFYSKVHLKLTPSLADLVRGKGSPGFMLSYKYTF